MTRTGSGGGEFEAGGGGQRHEASVEMDLPVVDARDGPFKGGGHAACCVCVCVCVCVCFGGVAVVVVFLNGGPVCVWFWGCGFGFVLFGGGGLF